MKQRLYKFIYLDKYNNELHSEVNTFEDIQEARSIAKDIHQNSMLNNLKRIKVIREYITNIN